MAKKITVKRQQFRTDPHTSLGRLYKSCPSLPLLNRASKSMCSSPCTLWSSHLSVRVLFVVDFFIFPSKAQSRSQSFVPLDQQSENESSGSIHFEITMGNNQILVIWLTVQSQSASISCYGACLKWLLPELSFSDRWSRGTKLWERD